MPIIGRADPFTLEFAIGTLTIIRKQTQPFDAMDLCAIYSQTHSIRVDWHEFSQLLDMMRNAGLLRQVGLNASRMEQYTAA